MDKSQNSANGSSKVDLIKDESESENTVRYGNRSASSQIMVAVAQNFLLVAVGMAFGMPTMILGALNYKTATNQTKLESPDLILDDEQSSWLGSILYLFHPVGAVISGYLVDLIGRKTVMIIVCVPFFLGWMFLYFAESVLIIMMGTISMGIGIGFCQGPIISYLGEVCEPRIRGSLTLISGVAGSKGIVVIYLVNAFADWRTTSLISSIFPLLAIVMLLFLPESPIWLISKGRLTEAEQSLRWLRGWSKKDKVRVEFDQIVKNMAKSKEENENNSIKDKSKIDKFLDELKYFKRQEVLRPFSMMMILFVITVLGSSIPMRPYFIEVFLTFGLPIKSEWVLILTGVLAITGSLISCFTVNKFGKRPMALWSIAICFISTLMLAICAMNLHWPGWIPLTFFCISFWISRYGMISLPWMLLSEIFPIPIRGLACGVCAALNSIISFLATKTYVNTHAWFGLHGTLCFYSFVAGVGFVYMYFYLPETEDRTLQEITDFFLGNGTARDFKRPKTKRKNKEIDIFTVEEASETKL
ncbi:facilitated trehalose transporter Tret1-like isoform X1 [Diaphorina citri]|uniref:Facilitated trehalose transporter Tret1-like isoform X1 n=1 Tax=Diaphorina citri TaxID=121845 RepID=A0A1S3D6K1_DIACI|nr:facilitated trehalose transporter Tret1-like isoform X1 [Diaphorina citri]